MNTISYMKIRIKIVFCRYYAKVRLFKSMLNTPNQNTSYLKIQIPLTKIRLAKSKIRSYLFHSRHLTRTISPPSCSLDQQVPQGQIYLSTKRAILNWSYLIKKLGDVVYVVVEDNPDLFRLALRILVLLNLGQGKLLHLWNFTCHFVTLFGPSNWTTTAGWCGV